MPKQQTSARQYWSEQDCLRLAVHALPYIDNGLSLQDSLLKAQAKALPRALRCDRAKMLKRLWNGRNRPEKGGIIQAIEKARALPPEERDAIRGAVMSAAPKGTAMPRPAGKSPHTEVGTPGARIYWRKLEWAAVAREVQRMIDSGDTRKLSVLYIHAQQVALVPERHRRAHGFYVAFGNGELAKSHAQGLADAWLLPADPPPAAEPVAELAVDLGPPETASEPAPAVLAPTPLVMPSASLGEALQAFAGTVSQAVGVLMQAQAAATLQSLDEKLGTIAAQVGASIAADIERRLRQTVLDTIAQELGGPVSPPAPSNDVAPAAAIAAPAQAVKRLKVDVVGVPPGSFLAPEIKKAFNGHTDLRIFDADSAASYSPHRGRHCIFLINSAPHTLKAKIKAAGIAPLWVKATAGHVIHAIEELHRSEGIPQ